MNLVILSKYHECYRDYLASKLPVSITLLHCTSEPSILSFPEQVDIILGDPDLCAAVIPHCTRLKWIQSTWAGVTPLLHHQRTGLTLTGIKQVFGKQMREYVFNYLLYFSRNTSNFIELQQQHTWQPPATESLYGKTLAIAGVGSIGKSVAHLAKAFDMRVIGLTRQSRDCNSVDQYFTLSQKTEFAAQADFLVILLPDTEHTRGIMDRRVFENIKPNSIVINAGRAASIDETAMLDALESQRIRAAVLDVFAQEPLPESSPLWDQPNLFITQHTSAVSKIDEVSEIFLDNLQRHIANQQLKFEVDWQAGY